jgi:pimeloyl-ACP methyl ester carboxylesterase
MKKGQLLVLAIMAIIGISCTDKASEGKAPITKPQITIEGGRLTPEGLWGMGRIGSAVSDIETGWLAYTVSYYSVEENRSTTWIRICNPFSGLEDERVNGLEAFDEFVGSEPAWFGSSGWLAFIRGGQLYLRRDKEEVKVEGAEDIEGFLFSPMRDKVILIKTVPANANLKPAKYPDLPLATGRIHEDLMYKHWDEWVETVPQPFLCELQLTWYGEGERIKSAKIGECTNLLEGTTYECPMRPFGGIEQLAWNPNNEEIAYTCRAKTGLDYAVSTNSDIYLYDLRSGRHKNITKANKGYDTNPSYSPDGQWIAWQSMERDGYESDQNRLMVMNLDTGERLFVTRTLDSDVNEFAWFDEASLLFTSVWHGTIQLYITDLKGNITKLTDGQWDLVLADICDHDVYLLKHSMREANEVYKLKVESLKLNEGESSLEQLTHENDNIYNQIDRSTVVPRWQKTSDGKDMLTWIIYPPQFDPNKKYPTILYCEGGPQSPVSQFWSFRWNFMMMSAGDYIIVAPNRRGLPGFGKAWNEQISGDYGGQCMKDYLTAIDEFCKEAYVDKDHLGCVGASFGGFSVYWLAGHHDKRFKAFIAHDGIFNLEMQYLETEEKWFADWDMGGAYWEKDNKTAQRTFANSPHKFVDKWDTPILCIHGEKDYRILANQAMCAFDAAKMRGVPAELLIFPDENHWVLKPQNGILWQREFRGWLDRWLKE